jgi:ATP-dependent helicase HepA
MGKTIQAGLVMRQLLLDQPGRRIGIIAPDALMAQWRAELLDKFYLDDFPTSEGRPPFSVVSHDQPQAWRGLRGVDLLVVDEAHLLARTVSPADYPYSELAALAHSVPRVLMLSATPFSRNATTHLALLHLLDPQLFRWEAERDFFQLLAARHELALAVFGIDEEPDPDNPELLELQFEEVRRLLPADEMLLHAMHRAKGLLEAVSSGSSDVDAQQLRRAVAAIRTHVSETYRLHHRVIRNRRHVIERQQLDEEGLLTPFEFTGRTRPTIARLESQESNAGAAAVAGWASRCAAAVLDEGLDEEPYAQVLGVLASRLGGPVRDLANALEYRVCGTHGENLSPSEKVALNGPPVLDFEASVLSELNASESDGLDSLADAIARRCGASQRTVVFCGAGTVAAALSESLMGHPEVRRHYAHLRTQSEADREMATASWRTVGGILIADDSGDVGRNFQQADLAFHVRLPWNPNQLEQRIGRVDRYGGHRAAKQVVVSDTDAEGIHTSWTRLLASAFGVFDSSISTLQEVVDDLAIEVWRSALVNGAEGFAQKADVIEEALRHERRRITELDILESSYGTYADGDAIARAVAAYEEDTQGIEEAFTRLIRGEEGFRFTQKSNVDGSVTFARDPEAQPLLSPRLLARLETVPEARTGFFDRWSLQPRRRLFRRGNPFIDGIEDLLRLDDRGQAVALWRLDQRWRSEPAVFFGFDFLVEANTAPVLKLLSGRREFEPIARRRVDAAFAPQHQRVWIPAHTRIAVNDDAFARYLSAPVEKGRDVNLNYNRIAALHSLLGGESNLAPVAEGCLLAAREHVAKIADLHDASKRAVERVRSETEIVLAQSRARSQATGLVVNPAALDEEVAMGKAIEAGVSMPVVQVIGVSCVVVSSQSWADYV